MSEETVQLSQISKYTKLRPSYLFIYSKAVKKKKIRINKRLMELEILQDSLQPIGELSLNVDYGFISLSQN